MENIYRQKLETINYAIKYGLIELRENVEYAKHIGHKGKFAIKLYLEEKYYNNEDYRKIDIENELLTIQKVLNNIYSHLEQITFDEIEGFQAEIDEIYSLLEKS